MNSNYPLQMGMRNQMGGGVQNRVGLGSGSLGSSSGGVGNLMGGMGMGQTGQMAGQMGGMAGQMGGQMANQMGGQMAGQMGGQMAGQMGSQMGLGGVGGAQSFAQQQQPQMAVATLVQPQQSQLQAQGMGLPQQQMAPAMQPSFDQPNSSFKDGNTIEDMLGPFPCVRLRGVPFEGTLQDVLTFFQGLPVLDVVIPMENGRTLGKALVLFQNSADAGLALGRDRQHIGRRYIEVFKASRMDYYEAVYDVRKKGGQDDTAQQHQNDFDDSAYEQDEESGGPKGVVKMRGLPFSANRADVLDFFRGFNVVRDSIVFTKNHSGRATGEAFVAFGSASEARRAMGRDRDMMGSRYVELFLSSQEELSRHVET